MATYKKRQHQPMFIYDSEGLEDLNKRIIEAQQEFTVREVDLIFRGERLIFKKISSSADVYQFVKEVIGDGIEIQEHFVVLYMNTVNEVIGYYKHSKGTINSTQIDSELIAAMALKTLSKALIFSHNHPSGNPNPSESDKALTKKVKKALTLFDIALLDHAIITTKKYYSFVDNAEPALDGYNTNLPPDTESQLRQEILDQLKKVTRANSPLLWQKLQAKEGYQKIEEQVIERVIAQQIVPAAIIPQIECEMDEL
jgi:hypothetical protein